MVALLHRATIKSISSLYCISDVSHTQLRYTNFSTHENAPWFFFKISALYKSFTYLLTYCATICNIQWNLQADMRDWPEAGSSQQPSVPVAFVRGCATLGRRSRKGRGSALLPTDGGSRLDARLSCHHGHRSNGCIIPHMRLHHSSVTSTVSDSIIPRLHDTTGCQTVWQPVECLYTQYNPFSNRFDKQFDNRLYRVNRALQWSFHWCQTMELACH